MNPATVPKLSVVDLSQENLRPGSSCWVSTCNEIKVALEEYGCFVASYDKLSSEFRKNLFDALKELFELSEETKMKNENPKPGHGYMKLPTLPRYESLAIENVTKLEACKNFTEAIWPEGNDKFSEIAHTYANTVAELQQLVMRLLFESYGLDEKLYESQRISTTYLIRFIKYRKCHETDKNTSVLRGHTDKSLVSILHSDDVKSLELRTKDGQWMHFEPSPSSYLVIIGDAGMAWSNDRLRSCYHRVTVDPSKERYSIVLFAFVSGVIETPKELVDDEHPLKYKPFDHLGLIKFFASSNVSDKMDSNLIKAYCGI